MLTGTYSSLLYPRRSPPVGTFSNRLFLSLLQSTFHHRPLTPTIDLPLHFLQNHQKVTNNTKTRLYRLYKFTINRSRPSSHFLRHFYGLSPPNYRVSRRSPTPLPPSSYVSYSRSSTRTRPPLWRRCTVYPPPFLPTWTSPLDTHTTVTQPGEGKSTKDKRGGSSSVSVYELSLPWLHHPIH